MSTFNYRAPEALFVVIIRDKNAEQQLKNWAKTASANVVINSNRMMIFEHRSLSLFQMNWPHDWKQVTIWDTWNKRHITVE